MLTPEIVVFQSAYPPAEAVRRISALCMPRGAASLSFRWLVGAPTVSMVRLEWYVKGSRPTGTAFLGSFDEYEGRVILRGRFRPSLGDQIFNLLWFFAAASILVACLYAGLIHSNNRALAGALLSGSLLAFASWTARERAEQEAENIAWVCSTLREALSKLPQT